jgi:hypothetical protein
MTNTLKFTATDLRDLYLEVAPLGTRVRATELLGLVIQRVPVAEFDAALDELAEREGVVVERLSVIRTFVTIS